MRRKSLYLCLAISAVLLCISAFSARRPLPHYFPDTWKSGDIIFIEGTSFRSSVVRFLEFGHTDYSHVGLIFLQDGTPFVIHADPKRGRVIKERWDEFLSADRADGAAVFRVIGGSDSIALRVSQIAKQYLSDAVLFDDEFDLSTYKKLYCTELVWRAYLSVGIDLRAKPYQADRKYLFPSELIDAKVIREIMHY